MTLTIKSAFNDGSTIIRTLPKGREKNFINRKLREMVIVEQYEGYYYKIYISYSTRMYRPTFFAPSFPAF